MFGGIERRQELTRAIWERLRVAGEKVEEKGKQQAQAASAEPTLGTDDWAQFMRRLMA
jgi:hypothetical protein